MIATQVKHIDEPRLESDVDYRFAYLTEFMGFGAEDIEAVRAVAPALMPLIPVFVDAVYDKLFRYDATKRHFLVPHAGFEGQAPADMASLTQDHELIQFRKSHLGTYLKKLFAGNYDDRTPAWLDRVGKIHTPRAGAKDVVIPLVQMDALMGFVADAVLGTILGLELDSATRARAVRAFNKLLWLQNDLIVRHYAG
jgi:Protoglobin